MVLWIITVADAYEAMTATSKYKRVFSNEKVLVELKRCAGTQFKPENMGVFERNCWRIE